MRGGITKDNLERENGEHCSINHSDVVQGTILRSKPEHDLSGPAEPMSAHFIPSGAITVLVSGVSLSAVAVSNKSMSVGSFSVIRSVELDQSKIDVGYFIM